MEGWRIGKEIKSTAFQWPLPAVTGTALFNSKSAPPLTAWSTASNEVDWNSLTHLCPLSKTHQYCFLFQNLKDFDFSQNSHQHPAAMDTAGINFLRQAELTLLWEKSSTTRILAMLHGVPNNHWQLICMSHTTQHKRKKLEYKHWIKPTRFPNSFSGDSSSCFILCNIYTQNKNIHWQ